MNKLGIWVKEVKEKKRDERGKKEGLMKDE